MSNTAAVMPMSPTGYTERIAWLAGADADTIVLDTSETGDVWRKADGLWYRPGVEAGYNPECVALEGPFVCIQVPA
jgi:hypothetical protein